MSERKSAIKKFGGAIIALALIFVGFSVATKNNQPTFKEWQAKMIESCTKMSEQNNAAYMKIFSADKEPTVEDFIAFEKYFEPDFAAFEAEVKAQDRPHERGVEVDDFVSAVEAYRANLQKSSTDRAAAEAEFAAGGQTDASMNFGKTASALGLNKCVG